MCEFQNALGVSRREAARASFSEIDPWAIWMIRAAANNQDSKCEIRKTVPGRGMLDWPQKNADRTQKNAVGSFYGLLARRLAVTREPPPTNCQLSTANCQRDGWELSTFNFELSTREEEP